jgi:hypothetical protein
MKLRSLKNNLHGFIDITVAITIGIVFAALMVVAYIVWTLRGVIVPASPSAGTGVSTAAYNASYRLQTNSIGNITSGFDQTIKIIIIAILVAVLAIALSYLMMLRHEG